MKLGFIENAKKVEVCNSRITSVLRKCRLGNSISTEEEKTIFNTNNCKKTHPLLILCFWILAILFAVFLAALIWFVYYGQCQESVSHAKYDLGIQRPHNTTRNRLINLKKLNPIPSKSDSVCPFDMEDVYKFDCHPQDNAEESACLKRGCCWSFTDKQFVPFCYYPPDFALYTFLNVSHMTDGHYNGVVAYLKQVGHSGYPEEIPLLKLVASFETRSRLRVKIEDAENKRYEVNLYNTLKSDELPVVTTDYEFIIDVDVPGFSIVRKSNREILFSTIGVGGFIYANQFIQISSFLPSSNIYGLGEHQDSLRHTTYWQRFAMFNHDTIPEKGKNLYGSHPFYLIMENDGLSHGVFLKNSDPMEVALQPAPAITFRVLGGVLDFYFFLGPTPQEVIQQYTEVIGRPAMPPYWSLGFHLCRFNYGSANRTREIWERTRKAGIPFDVQWNDIDYMETAKDFTFDREKFAELPALVKDIQLAGMHWVPIIDPGISNSESHSRYSPYDEGIAMNIFIKNSTDPEALPFVGKVWNTVSTVWPDFTHPNATEYWTNQLKAFHNEVPFDGAWIDMNEPSNFYSGTIDGCPITQWDNPPYTPAVAGNKLCFLTLCMSAGQFGGLHYDLHNLYGFTETIATNFALKQITEKRPFIISRSTFPGQGHYGGHWSGDVISDWDNLRRSVISILNYNMFGIPLVGADICGFNGNTTVSLCQRWMELGAFYPFSRNHNTDDAIDQDPVGLGPEVVEASKKALLTRYMLLPYFYTLFWHAHAHGHTVVRPLFFEFPFDRQTYGIDTQFLWGGALMVAPVVTEATEFIEIYLPRSLWYDFYSLQLVSTGGKWTGIPAPLDTIPLLLRGGFILPTQAPEVTTSLTRQKPLDLLVTLNETGQAVGELYWDDGETIDTYLQSHFTLIRFEASEKQIRSAVISWKAKTPPPNMQVITILGLKVPVSHVEVNGVPYFDFTYNSIKKVMFIKGLDLPIQNSFVISYH